MSNNNSYETKFRHLKQSDRKKVLLLCDDI